MQTQEARMHDRVPFTDQVTVLATPSSPPLKLWANNLSEGGVCIMSNHPFRRGDRVGLRLKRGGRELNIPVGEVSWVVREVKNSSRIPMVGLRFVNLRPADRLELKKLVETAAEDSAPLPPLTPMGAPANAPAKEAFRMHAPSLPPIGDSFAPNLSMLPTENRLSTLPPLEPSLGSAARGAPAKGDALDERWEFSGDAVSRPSMEPRGTFLTPPMAFGAGLLVVGTLAGLIFGVLDQRGAPVRKEAQVAAAAPEQDAPAVEEEAPNTTAEIAPEPAAPARAAPVVVAAAPVPAVAAPRPAVTPTSTVARPLVAPAAAPARAAEKLPLPVHRPGRVTLDAVQQSGKEIIVPIRGARGVEKQFLLKNPERVVLDLTADGFDGVKEIAGKGSVKKVRLGARAGGVRVVLDVKDARVAGLAKVTRRNGVMAVVLPAQ